MRRRRRNPRKRPSPISSTCSKSRRTRSASVGRHHRNKPAETLRQFCRHNAVVPSANNPGQRMRTNRTSMILMLIALTALTEPALQAQEHRATRLGNPATRFAAPLQTPDDLRKLLGSELFRNDVEFVVRECGFQGEMPAFHRAVAEAYILPLRIPVGTRLPAMSSRRKGKPVLLRDVLWAGKKPIDAYEFRFSSLGEQYRVVAPRACANFWVEHLGAVPRASLTLRCESPSSVTLGRPANVCLVLSNTGDAAEPRATVSLAIPATMSLTAATGGGEESAGDVVWEIHNLGPGESRQLCATFDASQTGMQALAATVRGGRGITAQTRCEMLVAGVPAVLLEVVDLDDPVAVGGTATYEITVVNQGSAALTRLTLNCRLADGQSFLAGSGTTAVLAQDREG
ncbi:MAG TPA: hypothetical protein DCY13_22950, partial [Verrucomicrobiales bacterium]|nr:hypothetical protein [Verrucomicrobiales bacterium]